MRDCQWQLPASGHSNPRTTQEAPVFSLFANGTLRAWIMLNKDPHGPCSKPTFTSAEDALGRIVKGACLTKSGNVRSSKNGVESIS
jgi:hypothetical protein